jgi:hypothetical protein
MRRPIILYERQSMWRAARSIGAQLVRLWRAASGYGGCPASVWKNPSEIESRQINKTGHF